MSTHSELVERAVRWLYGTKDCNVVLSGNASTSEVPDAIGWSTSWSVRGSVVVECKTSASDFHRDRRKKHGPRRMGHFRYFLIPSILDLAITPAMVESYHPDHGLLVVNGNRVFVRREAKRRDLPNLDAEVRCLQFALIHVKHNLLDHGCTVNMCDLTKFAGMRGITFPQPKGALHGFTVPGSPA